MDFASIIGASMGTGIMIWMMHHEGGIPLFINIPGIILVFGGTIAAAMFSYPMAAIAQLPSAVKKCFYYPLPSPPEEIERMAGYALLARREGLLGLEEKIKGLKDPFLSKGVSLVIDGFAAESVRGILETDVANMKERHLLCKKMVDNMTMMAPGYGMVGTLLGLVGMLANLSDPSTIGGSMAVSLLATFYGAMLANVVFMPLSAKMETRAKEEAQIRTLMIEGILGIQQGDKPQVLQEKMKAFLSPRARRRMKSGNEKQPEAAAK